MQEKGYDNTSESTFEKRELKTNVELWIPNFETSFNLIESWSRKNVNRMVIPDLRA